MTNVMASKETAKTGGLAPKGALSRREPWQPLEELRSEIDQLFDNFMPSLFDFPKMPRLGDSRFDVTPKVDVTETDKEFRISAGLPGMDDDDVEVTLSEGMLTIQGEKSEEKEHKGDGEQIHWTERSFGSFRRSFRVPPTIDESKVSAEFKKGILNITLPKSAEAQKLARKIEIKS